jgi:hypothetical protein
MADPEQASPAQIFQWDGFCPICRWPTTFRAENSWFRDHLMCMRCPDGSVPRERALMMILDRLRPNWRWLRIHESSPAPRGVSPVLQRECAGYVASQYFPDRIGGEIYNGFRCEDISSQTFPDKSFDIVITQDVMEHVFDPARAHREIYRTLRQGGVHIHTVPVDDLLPTSEKRAELSHSGEIIHLFPPEYHGNPVDEKGALVTYHYGHDLVDLIATWAPFSVEVVRMNDRYHGVVGPYTEVFVCSRR